MFGYVGTLLRIDLTNRKITKEPLDLGAAAKFIGGRGLGTAILAREIDPKVDALSPANKLILATGPLTGTAAPTGGRYMVVTKSPLTGTVASSNSGGFWGAELKNAGYDAVIFEGKASSPVYLSIADGEAKLEDASGLWGSLVGKTTDALVARHGEKARVLCIGPAGEKLSLLASVMNDKDRAAGRSGVGAVMGSKNLKAVVVRGTGTVAVKDPEALKAVVKDCLGKIKANGVTGSGLPTYGTAVLVNIINENGVLPTDNFQRAYDPKAEAISGESLAEKFLKKREACYRCPIGCGRYCETDGIEGGGPEYETIWAFGSDCGVNDLSAIVKANYWCNEYGLDTISAGATLAAAMELKQRGLVPAAAAPGLEFGNAAAVVEWTRKMGALEGFGADLAAGSARLCEKYGAPELSMTVKRQEIPAYDPRGIQGHGLQYATSNRGGCHVRGYLISPEILALPEKLDRFSLDGKAAWAKGFQDLTASIDSLGLCLFTSFAMGADDYAKLLNAVCGTEHTGATINLAGDRIWNLERNFNLAAGIAPSEDRLPKRLLEDPIPDGPSKGWTHKLDVLLPQYYELRGWSKDGLPTKAKLAALGLE